MEATKVEELDMFGAPMPSLPTNAGEYCVWDNSQNYHYWLLSDQDAKPAINIEKLHKLANISGQNGFGSLYDAALKCANDFARNNFDVTVILLRFENKQPDSQPPHDYDHKYLDHYVVFNQSVPDDPADKREQDLILDPTCDSNLKAVPLRLYVEELIKLLPKINGQATKLVVTAMMDPHYGYREPVGDISGWIGEEPIVENEDLTDFDEESDAFDESDSD
jgi:hypothetical protein